MTASSPTVAPIKIVGLRDFQKALKDLDGESQKQLRVVLNTVSDTVAQGAARRVPVRTGRARASLRAQSSQREAKVIGGSKKAPYYGWLDFGGTVGKGRVSGGFKKRAGGETGGHAGSVKRRFLNSGRYMYPALDANRDSINKALQKSLEDLAKSVGLEVTASGG